MDHHILKAFYIFLTFFISNSLANECNSNKLVVYKVVFSTFWDRELFPRQYPEWRPPAQWSKLVGFSHSSQYQLFQVGEISNDAVKNFAETGDSEALDKEPLNLKVKNSVLDVFTAPPIEKGVGKSTAKLFVDGNHSQISLISKIVPSPDWFVGVDSVDLCQNGRFIDTMTLEADPLDAGTDNGFTFTSPNWPTTPQGIIFKITNTYPTHPAGSFYYPELNELPTIASFTFIKEKEYELSEVFNMERDSDGDEILHINNLNNDHQRYAYETDNMDDSLVSFIPKDSDSDIPLKKNKITDYYASTGPTDFMKKKYQIAKEELFGKLSSDYRSHGSSSNIADLLSKKIRRKKIRKLRNKYKHLKHQRNCKVSEWSDWGSCSKSCGIGESIRVRKILKEPKNGGHLCPSLKDVKWCGSARNCRMSNYFSW